MKQPERLKVLYEVYKKISELRWKLWAKLMNVFDPSVLHVAVNEDVQKLLRGVGDSGSQGQQEEEENESL